MLLFNKSIFVLIVLQSRVACKRISKQASKLLEKETKKRTETSCKSTAVKNLMRLRAEEKNGKLISCLLKALQSTSDNSLYWSLLGETYDKTEEKSKANTCFKEAIKLGDKVSDYIKEWDFIGPFTIGKSEVDGDPLEEWGGVENVSRYRWHKEFTLYSELSLLGEIKWTRIKTSAENAVQVSPKINWNDLVMSLQSIGITEWQGWSFGDLVTNEDSTLTVQCLSVHTMYLDGKIMNGDLYRRDEFWFPVFLRRGIHALQVKLRAKGPQVFQCNIQSFHNNYPFKLINPSFLPDLVDGQIFSRLISLPVNNLQSSKWLKVIKVSVAGQSSKSPITVKLLEQSKDFSIAPGQVRPVILELKYKTESSEKKVKCQNIKLTLKVTVNDGKSQQLDITLRCRQLKESFLFTFFDHDGSVQHAAAILPLKPCVVPDCPVLLTLHGTTVPPQNQADSYKRMVDGKWVFGVENLWVLAPTRHGAHNWEGPGELTAMSALRNFAKLTEESSLTVVKAHAEHIVFAGHSMGGHGAWQLSTHYPDQALAVISMAGWNKKEDYGDSNLFFRHDVSTSHTDPAVKMILEACVAENDADKHTSNLHGIPVMIRTGAADKTVHPYFARRMYRLLREQHSNVTYSELPGKEHWWWDTFDTNDGGVVNDPVIRKFAIEHAREARSEAKACDVEEKRKNCKENEVSKESKYTDKKQLTGRNAAGSRTFMLTVYNPASCTGVRGVRVIQQKVPFRKSTVVISLNGGSATLTTVNVERLAITEPAISPVHWQHKSITIDNVEFSSRLQKETQGKSLHFCTSQSSHWILCDEGVESSRFRGPGNLGPARRAAERPFIIVTGTSCDKSIEAALLHFSVYIANLFYLTSDALAYVIKDKELSEETAGQYNLIIVGSPSENALAQRYHDSTPLKYKGNQISLGDCSFHGMRTGAVFLAPHTGNHLTLVISGNSLDGIRDAVHLATPTIPPMTRSPFSNMIPDYVITGPRFGALGQGGYLCTGFWGNRWEYRTDISSCAC